MFRKTEAPRPKQRVKILHAIAGGAMPQYGLSDFSMQPGQMYELDAELANAWVASGVAELAQ